MYSSVRVCSMSRGCNNGDVVTAEKSRGLFAVGTYSGVEDANTSTEGWEVATVR